MPTELAELRAAQARAGQLADMPMIRRLAEIARKDHEENARYRVFRSEIVGMRRQVVVTAAGLSYEDARWIESRLNRQERLARPNATSWTRPMYLVQMEPRTCLVEVPCAYMTDREEASTSCAAA